MRRRVRDAFVVATLLAGLPVAAWAQNAATSPRAAAPVTLKADTVTHSRDGNVLTATGNVEIAEGGRVLRAEKVVYDRVSGRLNASGNVIVLDPDGNAFFADSMAVSGDLKDGAAERIRIRLGDRARLAGAAGRRIGGSRTELDDAVFTACPPCEDDPGAPPAWRIAAGEVVRDTDDETITYRDAVFELWGVPVFYTPYFRQPDIDVRRKTGLLVPVFGVDGELGAIARLPVFWAIAPDRDATISPILTEKEGVVGLVEYRQRFPGGALRAEGSITSGSTDTETRATRGHLDADIAYDIDDAWRAGGALSIASDDTYLGRYDFSEQRTLTSRAFVEGFWGRNYAAANFYRFQGLRPTDEPRKVPLVVPEVDFNFLGARDRFGGRTGVDANLRSLVREFGSDSVRLSLNTAWQLPYTSPGGQRLNLFARLQTDAYWVEPEDRTTGGDGALSKVAGRVFPQAGLDWRYPFIRAGGRFSQIVEPIVGTVVAPRGGNPDRIPNEDSLDLELDDTNVFDRSRVTGLDLVEDGARLYYGLRGSLLGGDGMSAHAFLGQSYRLDGSDLFPAGAGLDNDFSDIVGRFDLRVAGYARLLYRFRYDHTERMARRDEVGAVLGPERFRLSADYLFVDKQGAPAAFGERREINLRLETRITDSIRLRGETQRDLAGGGSLWHRASLGYRGDCYTIDLNFKRSLTRDRDIRPTDTFFMRIGLTAG
ncbi:MAG: LPS assembly protein LptD [Defluviicoccus sp.]|nr:LPS assembly protein LptD [Defluviicoccus sp.]